MCWQWLSCDEQELLQPEEPTNGEPSDFCQASPGPCATAAASSEQGEETLQAAAGRSWRGWSVALTAHIRPLPPAPPLLVSQTSPFSPSFTCTSPPSNPTLVEQTIPW